MKTIFSTTLLLALVACGTAKIKGNGEGQTINNKKMEKLQPAVLAERRTASDTLQSTNIDSAYIEGNTMWIKVSYSGGCEEHHFDLEGNTAISKSLPPIRNITLIHSGKKDGCKAMIIKTLQFDIREFAYQKEEGSQIKLNLEGYKPQLMYTYSAK